MHKQIKLHSVESKSSWVVASVVLVILALSFGAPWVAIVALKAIAADTGGLRSVPALASALAWLGFGTGGIVMGYVAERVRHPLDRDLRRGDDRNRARALDRRRDLATLRRPGPVHGLPRHRRHECAVLRLCEPLVRSPSRLGAGADLERQLRRRRDLAVDLRARHRPCRLAADHDLLRLAAGRGDRAAGRGLPALATGNLAPERARSAARPRPNP